MRSIGSLPDEVRARRIGDFLTASGMPTTVESSREGWELWVREESHVEAASAELERFKGSPDDPRYRESEGAAEALRRRQAAEYRAFQRQQIDPRRGWSGRASGSRPVTFLLIGICLLVAGMTKLGKGESRVEHLLLFGLPPSEEELERRFRDRIEKDPEGLEEAVKSGRPWRALGVTGFERIQAGEVWRLVTPMFLHFGLLHLLFNLFWLHDLGGAIEGAKGALKFGGLVLACSLVSCVSQNLWSGPTFGGMSGVVYGLFGYVWMKHRFRPDEGLRLAPGTIQMQLIWLVLCMTGLMGPVANAAHLAGLLTGMAAAFIPRR